MGTIMIQRNEHVWLTRLLLCACLLGFGAARSAELDYALSAGVDASDNIDRLPADTRNSVAAVAGLELNGRETAGRLQYDIATDVAYYNYVNRDDLDPELRGQAFMRGSYGFLPDRFGWNASLGYSQLRQDPQGSGAPGNRESLTSVATGPWMRLRLGDAMEADVSGQYARQAYGKRPFDNETWGGRALLARRPNPRSMLALGFAYDQVSYISSPVGDALDFRRREAFVRTELQGARTELQLEVGYSDMTGQLVDSDGPVLRLDFNRRLTPLLTGFVSATREYITSEPTDQQIVGPGQVGEAQLTGEPRRATRFEGGVRFGGARTQFELAYLWRNETAQTAQHESRDLGQARGSVTRAFTPRVRGSLFASFGDESFSAHSADALEHIYGAQLGIELSRSLGLDVRLQHAERDGNAQFPGYSEMSGGLFLRYGGTRGAAQAN